MVLYILTFTVLDRRLEDNDVCILTARDSLNMSDKNRTWTANSNLTAKQLRLV
jgi:hypothetical protein